MLTVLLILFPLVSSIPTFFTKGSISKWIAAFSGLVQVGLTMTMLFNLEDVMYAFFSTDWIPSLGIQFYVGVDALGYSMVALTNVLVFLIILSSFQNPVYGSKSSFYGLVLLMQSALVGVFTALDCFLFYVFWEAALIPVYFIAAFWGGENRIKVTFKFFIYTIFGSLFMLIGIIYAYLQTELPHSFDIFSLKQIGLEGTQEVFVFTMFFLAFAIKMPIFPFHSWQPETYTQAPAAGTMLLSGIMLKMGIYGVIRWILPITPAAVINYSFWIILFSVVGILYASTIALQQHHAKRLVAFSSIAHVGLILGGLATWSIDGLQGGIIQMISHGINVVGLFFILEIIDRRTGTLDTSKLGGIAHKAPILSICFMIILLGSVALPLTNGFVGEFLLLKAIFTYNAWLGALACLTVVLGAMYMLRMYKSIMLGETNETTASFYDITKTEALVLIPICVFILSIGIYPSFILDFTEPTSQQFLELFKNSSISLK